MIIDEGTYLTHHGVKGMKWGERRARNRQLNKAHKEEVKTQKKVELDKTRKKLAPPKKFKDFKTDTPEGRKAAKEYRRQQIDRARARINSGAMRADFKEAKSQYKQDKITKGSKAAKDTLRKHKAINRTDVHIANQIRDGKELAGHIVGALAGAALRSTAA